MPAPLSSLRNSSLKIFALSLLASSFTAFGGQVTLVTTPYSDPVYSNYPANTGTLVGYGGEFTATATGLSLSSAYVSGDGILSPGTFETFCVELNQEISTGTLYNYTLSNRVVFDSSGDGEPLAIGVAWLYSQFVSGALSGYNYAPAGRAVSSAQLQNAIWELMQETLNVDPDAPDPATVIDLTNPFIKAVALKFGGSVSDASVADAEVAANGAYGVSVMDVTSSTGAPLQDQLVMVPDAGATIALFGIALLGLAAFGPRRQIC